MKKVEDIFMGFIKFLLKQLLPLKYEHVMVITHNEKVFDTVRITWRMWLFKPFCFKSQSI